MTAGMVHVTNLAPPGSDNPSRAYGNTHQSMTPGVVRVTDLTSGSEWQPTAREGTQDVTTAAQVEVITASGLRYVDLRVGGGEQPKNGYLLAADIVATVRLYKL
jgi:hypothetical protein